MNKKLYTGLGLGIAAAASAALLAWPTKNRKRRMAAKALGRMADDLSSAMKIF